MHTVQFLLPHHHNSMIAPLKNLSMLSLGQPKRSPKLKTDCLDCPLVVGGINFSSSIFSQVGFCDFRSFLSHCLVIMNLCGKLLFVYCWGQTTNNLKKVRNQWRSTLFTGVKTSAGLRTPRWANHAVVPSSRSFSALSHLPWMLMSDTSLKIQSLSINWVTISGRSFLFLQRIH